MFFIWVGALVVYYLFFELGPVRRGQWVISSPMADAGFLKILPLVSPVVGIFALYWFGENSPKVRATTISRQRWHAAVVLTLVYHFIIGTRLFNVIFLHDYSGAGEGEGAAHATCDALVADTFEEAVDALMAHRGLSL